MAADGKDRCQRLRHPSPLVSAAWFLFQLYLHCNNWQSLIEIQVHWISFFNEIKINSCGNSVSMLFNRRFKEKISSQNQRSSLIKAITRIINLHGKLNQNCTAGKHIDPSWLPVISANRKQTWTWWWYKLWVGRLKRMNMWSMFGFSIKMFLIHKWDIQLLIFFIDTCISALYLFQVIQCFILNDSDQWVPCRHWRTTRMYLP